MLKYIQIKNSFIDLYSHGNGKSFTINFIHELCLPLFLFDKFSRMSPYHFLMC